MAHFGLPHSGVNLKELRDLVANTMPYLFKPNSWSNADPFKANEELLPALTLFRQKEGSQTYASNDKSVQGKASPRQFLFFTYSNVDK